MKSVSRPFFLLEVLIATLLVGGFAYVTIQGSFQVFMKQRAVIQEMEYMLQRDTRLMKAIAVSWSNVDALVNQKNQSVEGFNLACKKIQESDVYLLELTEGGDSFCYVVNKPLR